MREVFVCSECGSEDVQMLEWINPNTGEVLGGNEDTEEESHGFCSDCDDNVCLDITERDQ